MLDSTYHDYSVLNLDFKNNKLVLEILSEPDEKLKITLVFSGVEDVIIDGEISSENLKMIYPDGGILSIIDNSNNVGIYIEWVDYKTRNSVTKSYEFECLSIATDRCLYDKPAN